MTQLLYPGTQKYALGATVSCGNIGEMENIAGEAEVDSDNDTIAWTR